MADFNALQAIINAYIKRNGVQAITGQILNGVLTGMVNALGKGYTVAGAASPTTDPGTMTGPLAYIAYTAGTYTHFDNIVVEQGEVSMLIYNEAEWHKEVLFSLAAQATVDDNIGVPSVGVSFVDGILTFNFRNMKGEPGENGQDGDPAGFGTISASISGGVGTPGVSVQSSGPDTAKNIAFQFTNLKGETGVTSCVVTVDNTTGTPSCAVSLVGQELHLDFSGLKGAQGNTGSSVDYPFEIVNNLTTNDATKALSAAMGVQLESEVSQLEAKVDEFATGKYYGTFTSSSNLPEGTIPGFAYVGTENPFEIYTFDGTSWSDSGATMDGVNIPSLNPFKGLYNSVSALESAYPNPYTGDYAYVKNSGTPATANIYNAVNGEWADTHIVVSITDMESVFPLYAKLSLISTLEKVAWIDENGQNYLNDLRTALLGNIELVSISAFFNPGTNAILDTMSLDDLKDHLTVTATFSDGTHEDVSGYQLSGTLSVGTNTITVTYLDETTTFTVTVKHNYAGALNTWTLHPQSGVAEYVNGYIRMKCVTTQMQSGYSVWCTDSAKTEWSEVNGKTLKVRLKINNYSSDVCLFGIGTYDGKNPTSLGASASRKQGFADTMTDAGGGWYEKTLTINIDDFTSGTYTPTSTSAFGLYCYSRAINTYIEIYDLQIYEV